MAEEEDVRPRALERLASAFSSSDLALRPRSSGAADVLVASGLTALHLGPVASALAALHSHHTRASRDEATDAVRRMVWRENMQLGWRLNRRSMEMVADLALAHHISPACPHCKGRGKLVAEGTPYLSGNICTHCRGTGKRPVQRKRFEEITQTIGVLDTLMEQYGGHMGRRLR